MPLSALEPRVQVPMMASRDLRRGLTVQTDTGAPWHASGEQTSLHTAGRCSQGPWEGPSGAAAGAHAGDSRPSQAQGVTVGKEL